MRFVIPFLLGLAWLTDASVIPSRRSDVVELAPRAAASGLRSVAYFVNWVSYLLF
jgi:hypothetical protein